MADARGARSHARRGGARERGVPGSAGARRGPDRGRAAHGLRDGRMPRVRGGHRERERAGVPRGPGVRPWRGRVQRGRARDRRVDVLMPWRRPRKKPERPVNVSRAIEETLEEQSDFDEEDDSLALADVDGASIVEAATGEPDAEARPTSPLAEQLSRVELSDSAVVEPVRSAERPEDGVPLAGDAPRGLMLKKPVPTASGTVGQGV